MYQKWKTPFWKPWIVNRNIWTRGPEGEDRNFFDFWHFTKKLVYPTNTYANVIFVFFSVPIKFKVATVPTSRVLPAALKANGLRNLPSIIQGEVAIDTVEEIIDYIDARYPTMNKINDATLNESVDKLTRNFFSKFCFYIKSVSKDSSTLVSELHRLDDLLKRTTTR